MLFLHESHRVAGRSADAFEAAFREGWAPALAGGDDARLLWYLHHAHGTGPSYTVVTITGIRDGAAWERLARRVESGDLNSWARDVDALRHRSESKILAPVEWSELREVPFAGLGPAGADREPSLYMEDTVQPHPGALSAYLEAASALYARDTIGRRLAEGTSLLELRACFRTLAGSNAGREVILWQRIVRPELLGPLLTREIPPEHRGPGTWMREALAFRDSWESRLLRTAPWSPLD